MFCALADLITESDVEQKFLWPLLTSPMPSGFGLGAPDILTKPNIRRIEVGKGVSRKLYFPDYVVVLAGLPLLIVEAKAPGEPLEQALAEARLYANEVNALFPSGVNPCIRIVACNGSQLLSSPSDTAVADVVLAHAECSEVHPTFAKLVELCDRSSLQLQADKIRQSLRKGSYRRAVSLVGGVAVENQELAPNTFGATIVGDYGHIFNPQSREERTFIAANAYIPSLRRQRYIEPIDRVIRTAVPPIASDIPVMADTSEPNELTRALRERRRLENQVLLLIGSVGAGKSTFVDYLSAVALPEDLRKQTLWVRINLNEAPLATQVAYSWISKSIIADLRRQTPDEDFDSLAFLEKALGPELKALRKGPLSLLEPSSTEYRAKEAEFIMRLQADDTQYAKCLARYLCAGPGRLLVIGLDNCDKRTRDEQLTMFQVAQWVQSEFRSLVVLPIRDVTFERHRREPPLDTALKGLVFRIEPPPFIDVLQARVRLALEEMHAQGASAKVLSYVLPNGIRVSYPASDQAFYLASILQSLYAHDRFVRHVMTGLAGRDVRRALEIFLDFCTSGHIGEDEIYKIRFFGGEYVLPLSVVARVLLRMHRRFYNGNVAYLKNLVQCVPSDALPDHFVRLAILHWLEQHQQVIGPAGVAGFHQARRIVHDLVQIGHDATRVRGELKYLLEEGCVVAEHLRTDVLADEDLVRITASGIVHLQLMANPDYLAACAEDTFVSDSDFAERVAGRIGGTGPKGQFSRLTASRNAAEFVDYLKARAAERLSSPDAYLEKGRAIELNTLRAAEAAVQAAEVEVSRSLYVGNVHYDSTEAEIRAAFEGHGFGVESVAIPRFRDSGKPRGFAFVELKDTRSALEALDTTGLTIRGRALVINESYREPPAGEPPRRSVQVAAFITERVYVGNLPYTTSKSTIEQLFRSHELEPVDVYVGWDRETNRSKGFAFVTLSSSSEAERAIGALHQTVLEGRSIAVRAAAPRYVESST